MVLSIITKWIGRNFIQTKFEVDIFLSRKMLVCFCLARSCLFPIYLYGFIEIVLSPLIKCLYICV